MVTVAGAAAELTTSDSHWVAGSSSDAPRVTAGRGLVTWMPPPSIDVPAGHCTPPTSVSGPPVSLPVAEVMVYPAGRWPQIAKVVSCWSVAEPLNMTLLNRSGPSGQALRSCTSTVSAVESVPPLNSRLPVGHTATAADVAPAGLSTVVKVVV